MQKHNKIRWDEMHFVFIRDYYDAPLLGTCMHNGQLCRFEVDWEAEDNFREYYNVYELTPFQRFKERLNQRAFELCVGKHWTYAEDGQNRSGYYYIRKPEWLHNLAFSTYYFLRKLWK